MPGIRRRALIDLDAFAANLVQLPLDARADAYGHGLSLVAGVALSAGAPAIVVSDEREAAIAVAAGWRATDVHLGRDAPEASTYAYGLREGGRAVMSLIGEVVALKRVAAGAGVSYGYTHRTSAPTSLALVALGYADGVPRLASNRGRVQVGENQFPLVGRIAMDQFVLDVGDAPIELGSDAVVFGDRRRGEPSANQWAQWTERPPWALTAGIASRVVRSAR